MATTTAILAQEQIFPQANIVAGVLVLVVGFGFHFLGQFYSVLNWSRAMELGLQEAESTPEYRAYEHGIAVADSMLGWTYAIAGIGLVADTAWGYVWAWLPAVVLTYHALSFWFWTRNQLRLGYEAPITQRPWRPLWFVANLGTGLLTIAVASSQMVVT